MFYVLPKTKLLSFDIVVSDIRRPETREGAAVQEPLHVAVAGTAVYGGEERIWHSRGNAGVPALNLTPEDAHEVLEYLACMQQQGYMLCAWNGVASNLKSLGKHAKDMTLAANIALKCFDPMFQCFNVTGFDIDLNKVADSMSIPHANLMDNQEAPLAWRLGDCSAVMRHTLERCRLANLTVLAIQKSGRVRWVTDNGCAISSPMAKLKSVQQVMDEPEPDQSWVDATMPPPKSYQWVQEAHC